VSGVAVGAGMTVGVYVDELTVGLVSETWYVTGVAVPENVESGVKVMTPVDVFTVYVPWLAIVTVVAVQLGDD
jgi:hypothetical protein